MSPPAEAQAGFLKSTGVHWAACTVFVTLFPPILGAQVIAQPSRSPAASAHDWERANTLMRDPALRGVGPASRRVAVQARGVGPEEWLAQYAYYGDVGKLQGLSETGHRRKQRLCADLPPQRQRLFTAVKGQDITRPRSLLHAGSGREQQRQSPGGSRIRCLNDTGGKPHG